MLLQARTNLPGTFTQGANEDGDTCQHGCSQLLHRYMKLLAAREGQTGAAAGCTEVSSQTVAPLAKGKPVQTLPVVVQDQACQACPLPAGPAL